MDLELLITSHNPLIAVETIEENRLVELVRQIAWRINLPLYIWDCNNGIRKSGSDDAMYKSDNPITALLAVQEMRSGIYIFKDLQHYLDDYKIQRNLKNILKNFGNRKAILFVSILSEYPKEIQELLITYSLPLPDKKHLAELLNNLLSTTQIKIELDEKGKNRFLDNLRGMTSFEAKRAIGQALANKVFNDADIELVASIKKKFIEKDQLVEYISPEDNFSVVGGLVNLKHWIEKRKIAFNDTAHGLPAPKGVLLIGVPGCGKTLCARAIANVLGVGLIKFDPGKIYSKYIGESEANLRKILKMAESLAPIVLLIDEVEKVLPSTGSESTDGGVSSRLFGTFLSWLQDKKDSIFVVATSNNIRALPPEFSRKGRFDEIFFVDLPDKGERKTIIEIHLKRRDIDPKKINIDAVVALTDGFSGSEIEEVILSSLYSVASGSGKISTETIKEEIERTIPLSKRDPERIEALRKWAEAHTVKA